MSTNNARMLNREELAAFEQELDQIRQDTVNDLGDKDARHIRAMIRLMRLCAVSGRALLFFGFFPPTWILGTLLLGLAKILENMEIGHNIMHGQYDWMNDPKLYSQNYEWDTASTGDDWRHSHNFMHHTYTNIMGKDRDVGYGILRVSKDQPWEARYLFNPLNNALLALFFEWGVALHDFEFDERMKDGQWHKAAAKVKPFLKKAWKQVGKDYVLFPLLALPFGAAPAVLLGNLIANLMRNLWSYAIIFCGHFPAGTETFEYSEDRLENETRGEWYLRQMNGSANIEGGRWFHILSGHLSHQIEHHLYPDIPAHRYAEMAPKVQAVCRKYGQGYNTGSFWRQFGSVMVKIHRYALPDFNRSEPATA